MSAALARLLPRASATSIADIDAFITVALFSGIGLVLSLLFMTVRRRTDVVHHGTGTTYIEPVDPTDPGF